MGFDHAASKRTISVDLNGDLLRQAERYTGDLSSTLETLLAEFISRKEVRESLDDETVAEALHEFSALHGTYGLVSEEYQDI